MAALIFDGHNDALSRLWGSMADPVEAFAEASGHVNVPNCAAGGMKGGFFAIYSPMRRMVFDFSQFSADVLKQEMPAMDEDVALVPAVAQAAIARRLHDAGQIEIVTDAADLARAFMADPVACVLHLEGADCIGPDLLALDALYGLGLRSLGPVWSRKTIFGDGVPFAFGRDGDIGEGLTEDGHRLVMRCKELGVVVDTSHLNFKGFWDVADHGLPLVATHSNANAVCLTSRNLSDEQLKAIGETGGIAGLNYGTVFLSEDAWETGKCGLEPAIRHLSHMVEVAGEDAVALGSDFDGAPLPDGMDSAADVQVLVDAMRDADFGDALIAKITHENWLAFLGRHFDGDAT